MGEPPVAGVPGREGHYTQLNGRSHQNPVPHHPHYIINDNGDAEEADDDDEQFVDPPSHQDDAGYHSHASQRDSQHYLSQQSLGNRSPHRSPHGSQELILYEAYDPHGHYGSHASGIASGYHDTEGRLTIVQGHAPIMLEPNLKPPVQVKLSDPKPHEPITNSGCCVDGGRVLAVFYAVMLIIVAICISVYEAVSDQWLNNYIVVVFLFYIYGVGIVFLIDIEIYLLKKRADNAEGSDSSPPVTPKAEHKQWPGTTASSSGPGSRTDLHLVNGLTHKSHVSTLSGYPMLDYSTDTIDEYSHLYRNRMFLRIGVAVFGLGSLIYEALQLKQYHETQSLLQCVAPIIYWHNYAFLVFLVLQIYFVFKHPEESLKAGRPLVRFGFMHLFATNICTWIRAVVRVSYEEHIESRSIANCKNADDNLRDALPYLFPCIVEYSLLCAVAMYAMFANVRHRYQDYYEDNLPHYHSSNVKSVSGISFSKSHRGLFVGLILLAGTCVSIILYHSYARISADPSKPFMVYTYSGMALHVITIIAIIVGWIQLRVLHFYIVRQRTLEEILLIICVIAALIYVVLKSIALLSFIIEGRNQLEDYYSISYVLLCGVFFLIQTPFLIDACGRDALRRRHKRRKPGRGTIMFIMIMNISMCLYMASHTADLETSYTGGSRPNLYRDAKYGPLAWGTMTNLCVPLLLLYYFQSAACCAFIWTNVYPCQPRTVPVDSGSVPIRTVSAETVDSSTQVKVIELKRRTGKGGDTEIQTVLSPISEV